MIRSTNASTRERSELKTWQLGTLAAPVVVNLNGINMLFRCGLVLVLASTLLAAKAQKPAPGCCESGVERLSPRQVKALLRKTEPMEAPRGDTVRLEGTVVLAIEVDTVGSVTCIQMVSGHPLIIQSAIDSVKQWKFQPYRLRGVAKKFCGRIAIRYSVNEHGLKYDVIEAP